MVYFQRIGPKIFLVRRNEDFRSTSPNAAERRSVEDHLRSRCLKASRWRRKATADVLVDATGFFVSDGYGAAQALRPGKYHVDGDRSAVYMPRTKAFPEEHRGGSHAHLCQGCGGRIRPGFPVQGPTPIGQGGGRAAAVNQRSVFGNRGERRAGCEGRDATRTLFAGRIAGRSISSPGASIPAAGTSRMFSSTTAFRSASPWCSAISFAASSGEEGPHRRRERASGAAALLRGPRRAGRCEERP